MRIQIPKFQPDVMQPSELAQKYTSDPRYLATPRSKETYEHCLAQLIGYLVSHGLGNSVASFTPENVEGFVAYLFANDMAPSSVNLRLSALSGLAVYGIQQKRNRKCILGENPVVRVKRPKITRPKERYLTLDELRALLSVECSPMNESR